MGRSVVRDALAGALAASVALGVAELASGAMGTLSLVVAVADALVHYAPGAVSEAAIQVFGTRDKPALLVAIVVVSIAIGALLGPAAGRSGRLGAAAFVLFGVVGALAGARDPLTSTLRAGVVAAVAAGAGLQALRVLLRAASPAAAAELAGGRAEGAPPGRHAASRRSFLRFAAGAGAVAAASTFTGRRLFGPVVDVEAERRAVVLPAPAATAASPAATPSSPAATASPPATTASSPASTPAPAAAADLNVPGLSSLVTPNRDFYRIDTVFAVPRIATDSWRLRVTGMVERPLELTLAELLEMGVREQAVTLACVSNEVGGDLIGSAVWLGVPLETVLARAGVRAGASQVVGRAVDGFTVGFPTDVALDGRPSLVAVAMNGEPLPASHGFPARLVVPGLYGYVSATKWLQEIELTTLEAFDAYWIPRGWAKQAPIKTQSRIDVPRDGKTVSAGRVTVAGVAWGGIRGISRVEVRMRAADAADALPDDPGGWREARLGDVLSASSWRQWVIDWDAASGDYDVEVRATDGTGETQTAERHGPRPDGATGYHRVGVRVAGA